MLANTFHASKLGQLDMQPVVIDKAGDNNNPEDVVFLNNFISDKR